MENEKRYTRFLVLGCGHTGTTLISGILHRNGFWGCDIEEHYEHLPLRYLCEKITRSDCVISEVLKREIEGYFDLLEKQSGGIWTLKDPTLADVIDVISPFIKHPYKIIFSYRHPANTVNHLMDYKRDGARTYEGRRAAAESEYVLRNENALGFLATNPHIPCLFVNYDDLVDRKLDDIISRFVVKKMDFSFINPRKRRAQPEPLSATAMQLYEKLNGHYEDKLLKVLLSDNVNLSRNRWCVQSVGMSRLKANITKIRWRLTDKTLGVPILWRIKVTIKKRYGWHTYAEKRGITPYTARGVASR